MKHAPIYPTGRCNNCFTYYHDENDLVDGNCPKCKTDKYLMDMPEIIHTVNMHHTLINTCQDVLKFLERTNQKDTNIYRQIEVNLSQAERK